MNKEELDILETRLQERGYRKFTSALSSNESWGWFKTIRKTDNEVAWLNIVYGITLLICDRKVLSI